MAAIDMPPAKAISGVSVANQPGRLICQVGGVAYFGMLADSLADILATPFAEATVFVGTPDLAGGVRNVFETALQRPVCAVAFAPLLKLTPIG